MMQPVLMPRETAPPSTPKAFSSPQGMGHPPAGPLTYQVYSGDVVPSLRSAPSHGSFSDVSGVTARRKPGMSLGARVCLALVAVCVVVGTASLVVLGTADDSRAKATEAPTARPPAEPAPAEPAPVVLATAEAAAPEPAPPPVASVSAPAKPSKAKARGGAAPALRGVAVPPNPFAGAAKTSAKKK
jgi:hypothetical protein